MIKSVFSIFLLSFFLNPFYAQNGASLDLAVKYQITSVGGTSPTFTASGIILDDFSRWDATNVQVGDSLYVVDGPDIYTLKITVISFAAGSSLSITAVDPSGTLEALPTGQSAILRGSVNRNYPTYIASLRNDLQAGIMNRLSALLDRDIGTIQYSQALKYASLKTFSRATNTSTRIALDSLIGYYSSRTGEIVIDTTVTTIANKSINSQVRFVKGGLITNESFTLTFSNTLIAPPRQQLWAGGIGTVTLSNYVKELYPYWWGAKGDEINDDTQEIQESVDVALRSKVGIVQLLAGYHKISKGIIIEHPNTFSVGLTLRGIETYDGDWGTMIECTHTDNFAIGIQNGRSITIENMYIRGAGYTYNPSLAQCINNTDAMWETEYGRGSRYSPYSGVVIDPFSSSVPADGGYPGFTAHYDGSQAGSSACVIRNVIIRYFIVAAMLTPHGTFGNGSEIVFDRVGFDRCREGMAFGFTQNRQVVVSNSNMATMRTGFTSTKYGVQSGPMPAFSHTQIGSCREILNASGNYGELKLTDVYSESLYSIGSIAGQNNPLIMTNCAFNFAGPNLTGGILARASMLDYDGTVIMMGGGLTEYTGRPVVTSVGKIVLNGVTLNQPLVNTPDTGPKTYAVEYHDCQISGWEGADQQTKTTDFYEIVNGPYATGIYPGLHANIQYPEIGAPTNTILLKTEPAGTWLVSYYEQATVTVDTVTVSGGTATFTSTDSGRYRVGDVLVSPGQLQSTSTPSGLSYETVWGVVTSVVSSTITVGFISRGITGGTKNIYGYRLRKYRPTLRANITSGSNKIVVTSKSTEQTVAQIYPVGQKICGSSGIKAGSYVTSVSADSIFISTNATGTATGIDVFDAICRGEFISTDGQYPSSAETYRTFGARIGDKLSFKNDTYKIGGVASTGGFTPVWKMQFKYLTGTTGSRPTPSLIDAGLEYFNTTTVSKQIWDGSIWNETGSGGGGGSTPLYGTTAARPAGNLVDIGTSYWNTNRGVEEIADGAIDAWYPRPGQKILSSSANTTIQTGLSSGDVPTGGTIFFNTLTGAVTLILTDLGVQGYAIGDKVTIKGDASVSATNTVTIDPQGSTTIDGSATLVRSTANFSITLQLSATGWIVVGQ